MKHPLLFLVFSGLCSSYVIADDAKVIRTHNVTPFVFARGATATTARVGDQLNFAIQVPASSTITVSAYAQHYDTAAKKWKAIRATNYGRTLNFDTPAGNAVAWTKFTSYSSSSKTMLFLPYDVLALGNGTHRIGYNVQIRVGGALAGTVFIESSQQLKVDSGKHQDAGPVLRSQSGQAV